MQPWYRAAEALYQDGACAGPEQTSECYSTLLWERKGTGAHDTAVPSVWPDSVLQTLWSSLPQWETLPHCLVKHSQASGAGGQCGPHMTTLT